MRISYCISVCDEAMELSRLLNQLLPNIDDEDEIVVLVDTSKVTSEVSQVINNFKALKPLVLIGADLNNDFATFKNNFLTVATGDWIIQLDADEVLGAAMLAGSEDFGGIKQMLEYNPNIDTFLVPRENYVQGITPEWIQKWGWRIDEKQRINFPDPQMRIFKNNKQISWKNPVHEVLVGYKNYATLPNQYCLIHEKTLERQIAQNELYRQI